jgi:protein dithiol oxidoreductase (disulfide-forming)
VFWSRALPENVVFTRIPVVYRESDRPFARLYYALLTMNRIDVQSENDLHHVLYDAVNRLGRPLSDPNAERALHLQAEFVAGFGVDVAEFKRIYQSAEVTRRVDEAQQLTRALAVTVTPSMVVDRKYSTNAPLAGSEWQLMGVVTELLGAAEKGGS